MLTMSSRLRRSIKPYKKAVMRSLGQQQDELTVISFPKSGRTWLQVMLGQGVVPRDYHPLADALTEEQLREKLSKTKMLKNQPLAVFDCHKSAGLPLKTTWPPSSPGPGPI